MKLLGDSVESSFASLCIVQLLDFRKMHVVVHCLWSVDLLLRSRISCIYVCWTNIEGWNRFGGKRLLPGHVPNPGQAGNPGRAPNPGYPENPGHADILVIQTEISVDQADI